MTTTENNKLIAEFMGFKLSKYKVDYVPSHLPNAIKNAEHLKIDEPDNLPFHSSWDWLIPVIEKCRESQIFGNQRLISNIDKRLMQLDLIATYRNTIDCIEWYNQNKKV